MKTLLRTSVAALALAVGAGTAHATLLQITGGADFTTPGINDFSAGWAGRTNHNFPAINAPVPMTISTTQNNVTLVFEYFFRESGFTQNRFNTPGGSFVSTDAPNNTLVGSPFKTFTYVQASAGAIDFEFVSEANPGNPNKNGEGSELAPNLVDSYGFFATTNVPGSGAPVASGATGFVVWLALDDSGNSNDDNHDDMVIRITSAIPEPASLALLGAGLLGLGLARRRRR